MNDCGGSNRVTVNNLTESFAYKTRAWRDITGNGHDLLESGRNKISVVTSPFGTGGAALFSGEDLGNESQSLYSYSPIFNFTQPFEIKGFWYPNGTAGTPWLISKGFNNNISDYGIYFLSGQIWFFILDSSGNRAEVNTSTIFGVHSLIKYRARWTGTQIDIAIDSGAGYVIEDTAAVGSIIIPSGYPMRVGLNSPFEAPPYYVSNGPADGIMDELEFSINSVTVAKYNFDEFEEQIDNSSETTLRQVKENQTNGEQVTKIKNAAGTTIDPATEQKQDALLLRIGPTDESAAATDTSTSGLNGLLKRLLQRITVLIGTDIRRGATSSAPSTVSVTTTATLLSSASSSVKQRIFRNTDAAKTLYIGYTDAITTANAPIAVPAGGAWVEDISQTAVYGIAGLGTITVATQTIST
jgi:hypothetical protein